MNRIKPFVTVFAIICLLAACDPGGQRRLNRETIDQELRRREPVKLTEGQIVEAARTQGRTVAATLGQLSPTDSSCCFTLPAPLLDSLEKKELMQLRCYALGQTRQATDALEQEILEAYEYNLEQQLPLQENVQALGQDYFLYTAPVTNGKGTSSSCAIWSIRLSRKQVILQML